MQAPIPRICGIEKLNFWIEIELLTNQNSATCKYSFIFFFYELSEKIKTNENLYSQV